MPVPAPAPVNAGRVLSEWRRRAGLTQRELAAASGVTQPRIARIERGHDHPRIDTLTRLMVSCGATLTAEPRLGAGITPDAISDLLSKPFGARLPRAKGLSPWRLLETLTGWRVDAVVCGAAGARLRGAPVELSTIRIRIDADPLNRGRLARAIRRAGGPDLDTVARARRTSCGTRWGRLSIIQPTGDSYRRWVAASSVLLPGRRSRYVPHRPLRLASIDDLIAEARGERRWDRVEALWAAREVLDGR